MIRRFLTAAVLAASSLLAHAQTAVVTDYEVRGFQLMRGTSNVGAVQPTLAACKALIAPDAVERKASSLYKCRQETVYTATFNPAPPCPVAPAPTVATVQCASPLVGSWQQTTTVQIGAYPACVRTTSVSPTAPPAGACTQPAPAPEWTRVAVEGGSFTVPANSVVRYGSGATFVQRVFSGTATCSNTAFAADPTPNVAKACDLYTGTGSPTTPSPPLSGPTALFFSAAGSNSNPGTEALPKRDLSGINVNALAAGTLSFRGGDEFIFSSTIRLMNPNVSAANPLVFTSYGTGQATLRWTGPATGAAFEWGEWEDIRLWAGYTFRNLRFDGTNGATRWGMWLRGVTDALLFEGNTFTGFQIALNAQGGQGVSGITVRGNTIERNSDMGMLGSFSNSLIEGNTIRANNFSGSGFSHGTYFSNFTNLTIRNNTYDRNSVADGICKGGNMTFHGQVTGLTIEGNTIVQDRGEPGCWLMSITQGYASAEWFRDVKVTGNRLINGGNSAIVAQSAPGIVIYGNVVINRNPTAQTAITVGNTDYQNGDVPDADAVVRNNIVCQGEGASGAAVNVSRSPGSVATGNVVRTGVDATTGVCALQ